MANLFFIHTPLQLMMAQMIIRQEGLEHNIMAYGYFGNPQFLDIYSYQLVPGMWQKRYAFPKISEWAFVTISTRFFRNLVDGWKNTRLLKRIIRENNIDHVFMGDINNVCYKLAAVWLNKQGIKVSFFEEGSSHYTEQSPFRRPWAKALIPYVLSDALLYRPLFGMGWAKYVFRENYPIARLPIHSRYSVVPAFHEKFDRQLKAECIVSDKMRKLIKEETRGMKAEGGTLVLTSPIYEAVMGKQSKLYIETLSDYFRSLPKGSDIFLKYHPREKAADRKAIQRAVEDAGLRYTVLGTRVNLPAEYYLQFLHFSAIVSFYNSTIFYNGYLYPRLQSIELITAYRDKCLQHGITNVARLNTLIEMAKKLER